MSQHNFPNTVSLDERIRWAQRDVEDAARKVTANPCALIYVNALAARIADLDALRHTLDTLPRNSHQRRLNNARRSQDHRTTEHHTP